MSGPTRPIGTRRLALARRLLPAPLRDRYGEQWAADLRDAAELDVAPASIAWGALRFAALTRLGPHGAEPEELERQSWHLARWGGALIGTSGVGATVGYLGFGGLAGFGQLAAVHPALVLVGLMPVLVILGAAAVGIALLWAAVLRRPRIHPMSVLVVIALSAGSALVALWPLAIDRPGALAISLLGWGLLLLVLGAVGALIVWGATPAEKRRPAPRAHPVAPARSGRVVLAASLAILGLIVLGLVEGLVWGVEDQAGGLPAAAVYAALNDVDRVNGIVSVLLWAALWSVGPLVLVMVRHRALARGRPIAMSPGSSASSDCSESARRCSSRAGRRSRSGCRSPTPCRRTRAAARRCGSPTRPSESPRASPGCCSRSLRRRARAMTPAPASAPHRRAT
ncbi:hypothetical protein OVN20_06425 [Microcella daejeonensis]|uniref:hypothetical protein n=1 Tax=Microcella daejeonensis TaxID=2994971 RepID=UPI0022721720|nr:hypothetical protein [Microcella daejeonensis]WAB85177.1 hypothetical protein OVN20_06425 [Microcella daejeonensis]